MNPTDQTAASATEANEAVPMPLPPQQTPNYGDPLREVSIAAHHASDEVVETPPVAAVGDIEEIINVTAEAEEANATVGQSAVPPSPTAVEHMTPAADDAQKEVTKAPTTLIEPEIPAWRAREMKLQKEASENQHSSVPTPASVPEVVPVMKQAIQTEVPRNTEIAHAEEEYFKLHAQAEDLAQAVAKIEKDLNSDQNVIDFKRKKLEIFKRKAAVAQEYANVEKDELDLLKSRKAA